MKYVGGELDVFFEARAWKEMWLRSLQPWLRGKVLEVGAGLGGTTRYLRNSKVTELTALEPDPALCARYRKEMADWLGSKRVILREGTLGGLPPEPTFDCIVYIDVLEHIQEDREELAEASQRLRPGGALVVLSPAFEILRSPFDDAVGHVRRYRRQSLEAAFPAGIRIEASRYLDSAGALLSLMNRLWLKSGQPTPRQIRFWNQWVIPVSRLTDRWMKRLWGRSVLVVGTRNKRMPTLLGQEKSAKKTQ